VGGGVGRQPAGGRQLGGRRQQAGDDHGDDQVPAAVAGRAEQVIEAEAAQHAEDGGDVAVRQGAADGQGFLAGWQGRAGRCQLGRRRTSLMPILHTHRAFRQHD
jgi:hypothetical protein